MDAQLSRLAQDIPYFFQTIQESILSALSNAALNLIPVVGNELGNNKRRGYVNWLFVEPHILDEMKRLGDPRIKAHWENNANGSNKHLEIDTPSGKFMVASADRPHSVPRAALYRQEITEQCFFREVFPDYSVFNDFVIPLYIVTYSATKSLTEPYTISIGRLSHDQRSWSSQCPITDLLKVNVPEEVVGSVKPSVNEEVIAPSRIIRIKSV